MVKPSAVAVGVPKVGVRALPVDTEIEKFDVVVPEVFVPVTVIVLVVRVPVGVPETKPVEELKLNPTPDNAVESSDGIE